jgi:hypothetical protein
VTKLILLSCILAVAVLLLLTMVAFIYVGRIGWYIDNGVNHHLGASDASRDRATAKLDR